MSAAASADVAPLGRMLVTQTRFQLLTRLRIPAFSVLSLGLPVMFYALFNATYAVANVMVFNFGMGIANERGRKLDLLQRAMPLPPVVAAVAQVVAAMLFALIALLILFAYAFLVGGVRLGAGTWLDLLWRLIIGAFPMIGLGMAIGYGVGANTAPAVVNAVCLPMAFLSGIFFPLRLMPDFLQKIGQTLPTYHYAELGWNVLGHGVADESVVRALLWLAGWAVVLIGLAVRVYRLDESRKFS